MLRDKRVVVRTCLRVRLVHILSSLKKAYVRQEFVTVDFCQLVERLKLIFEHQDFRVQHLLNVYRAKYFLCSSVLELNLVTNNFFVFAQLLNRVLNELDGCALQLPVFLVGLILVKVCVLLALFEHNEAVWLPNEHLGQHSLLQLRVLRFNETRHQRLVVRVDTNGYENDESEVSGERVLEFVVLENLAARKVVAVNLLRQHDGCSLRCDSDRNHEVHVVLEFD